MNFEGLIPVIQCDHIEQTLDFYQQAFRFIIINKTVTSEGLQWAYLKSDKTFLMLQKRHEVLNQAAVSGAIILHFFTTDVIAQHNFMSAKGYSVSEIEETPYRIRQFFITDPENNHIAIVQDINDQ